MVQPLKVVLLGRSNKRWLQGGQEDEAGLGDSHKFVSEQKLKSRCDIGSTEAEGECVLVKGHLKVQASHSPELW